MTGIKRPAGEYCLRGSDTGDIEFTAQKGSGTALTRTVRFGLSDENVR